MEILEDRPSSNYLKHKVKEEGGHRGFWLGSEPLKFKSMQVDFNTLKTGWGFYNGSSYEYVWDDVVGSLTAKPSEEHKRAFYLWVYTDGFDTPLLWNNFTVGEYESVKNLLRLGWNDWQKDKELMATYVYEKSVEKAVGKGTTSIAEFKYMGCRARSKDFVIPEWDNEEPLIANGDSSTPSPNEGLDDLVNNAVEATKDTNLEDDIPF